jgi:hypothetical protein
MEENVETFGQPTPRRGLALAKEQEQGFFFESQLGEINRLISSLEKKLGPILEEETPREAKNVGLGTSLSRDLSIVEARLDLLLKRINY